MFKIKCSNCGYEKNEFDIICSNCAYVEKKDDFIKRLNKMYANRLYGKYGIPDRTYYSDIDKLLYTDTDSFIANISVNCDSYWIFKGIKFPCQLKTGHKGMHINNPIKDGHVATILWWFKMYGNAQDFNESNPDLKCNLCDIILYKCDNCNIKFDNDTIYCNKNSEEHICKECYEQNKGD